MKFTGCYATFPTRWRRHCHPCVHRQVHLSGLGENRTSSSCSGVKDKEWARAMDNINIQHNYCSAAVSFRDHKPSWFTHSIVFVINNALNSPEQQTAIEGNESFYQRRWIISADVRRLAMGRYIYMPRGEKKTSCSLHVVVGYSHVLRNAPKNGYESGYNYVVVHVGVLSCRLIQCTRESLFRLH